MKNEKRKKKGENSKSIMRKIEILEAVKLAQIYILILYLPCFFCLKSIFQFKSEMQIILIFLFFFDILCLILYILDKIRVKKLDKLKKEYKKIFFKKVYTGKKVFLKNKSYLKRRVAEKIKTNIELIQIDDEKYKVLITVEDDEFQFDLENFDEIIQNLEINQQ